jgi:MFS transporter, Spinster family, sphingosine-1-phosphate transporter
MAFDFIDRQVVISMFPHLKADWGVSDSQPGALVSTISITIAVRSLPISLLTDRRSRVKSIIVMGSLWSVATVACAFARNYGQLLAARGFIGLGEAGYGPAGGAILASASPARLRATVIGGFLSAASVSSVLGVVHFTRHCICGVSARRAAVHADHCRRLHDDGDDRRDPRRGDRCRRLAVAP